MEVYSDQHTVDISDLGSFICDKDGKILMMTNGCRVYDKDYNIVPGTDHLSPGWLDDGYCDIEEEIYNSYPIFENCLFFPDLTNDSIYYLIHSNVELTDAMDDLFIPISSPGLVLENNPS